MGGDVRPVLLLAALVAASGHGHRIRIGAVLLGLVVIAALVYGGVQLSRRRERRATHAREHEDAGTAPSVGAKPPPPFTRPAGRGGAGGAAFEPAAAAGVDAMGAGGPPPSGHTSPAGPPTVEPVGAPTASLREHPVQAAPMSWGAPGGWAVETSGLTKRFGSVVAVDGVDLLVPRGCAFGYLGPNGAGKTTLIRTLLGLTHSDGGTMSLLGLPVPEERSRALAKVGAIVDEPRFHGHLTGRENLTLLAAARGDGAHGRIQPALERVGLGARADDKVRSYSMGMRQRLGVAACLLGDPDLLILDEPMNGLDPAGMHEMRSMIRGLVDEGRTVMLSSHLLDEVERTCDAVAIVDRGRVVRQGPIDELVNGAGARVVRIECSDAAAAAKVIEGAGLSSGVRLEGAELQVSLLPHSTRDSVAEIVRALVEADIAVYQLQEARTSLEEWFLSVTSRLGQPA